jgi:hypothetical protein
VVAVSTLVVTACSGGGRHTPAASGNGSSPAGVVQLPAADSPTGSANPNASATVPSERPSLSAAPTSKVRITVTAIQVPIPNGQGATATVDQPAVAGAAAAATETIRNVALNELAAFGMSLPPRDCGAACAGCSACSVPIFRAQWSSGRADSTIVSGRWAFTTYVPGAAHPYTWYQSVIVDPRDGDPIDPWELFDGNSLVPLAHAAAPLLQRVVGARAGCGVTTDSAGEQIFEDGVAPKPDNYRAVTVVSSGLEVTTAPAQLAAYACGDFEVVVPWGTIQSSLNDVGRALADGQPLPAPARQPMTGVPSCTDGQVIVSVLRTPETGEAGLSHGGVLLRFAPFGTPACTLYGYPGVAGLDAGGSQIMQATRTPSGYLGGIRGPQPSTVVITSLSAASALVEGVAMGVDGRPCDRLAGLLVTPPGLYTSQEIDAVPPACGGLQVHPVVAGVTGDG